MACPCSLQSLRHDCLELRGQREVERRRGGIRRLVPISRVRKFGEIEIRTASLTHFLECAFAKALRCHGEGETRWDREGLLRPRQDKIEVPRVEAELRAADAAHTIDHAYRSFGMGGIGDRANVI